MKRRRRRGTGYKYFPKFILIDHERRERQIEQSEQGRGETAIRNEEMRQQLLLEQAYAELMIRLYTFKNEQARIAIVAFLNYVLTEFDQAYPVALEKLKSIGPDCDYDMLELSIPSASKYVLAIINAFARGFNANNDDKERLRKELKDIVVAKIELQRDFKRPPAFDEHVERSARLFWRKYRRNETLSREEIRQIIDGFKVISFISPHESSFGRADVWGRHAQLVEANAAKILSDNRDWGRNLCGGYAPR